MFTAISKYNESDDTAVVLNNQLKECVRSQLTTFKEKLLELTADFNLSPEVRNII